MTLDDIAGIDLPWRSYFYLATVYSKHAAGIEAAFQEATRIAGAFAKRGIAVYSPIVHSHPVALASGLDPLDHDIWLPLDEPMMRCAYGLVVVCMDGWKESKGISYEITTFQSVAKPVWFMKVPE